MSTADCVSLSADEATSPLPFPPEVWDGIFAFLPPSGLLAVSTVCRLFRSLVHAKYSIERMKKRWPIDTLSFRERQAYYQLCPTAPLSGHLPLHVSPDRETWDFDENEKVYTEVDVRVAYVWGSGKVCDIEHEVLIDETKGPLLVVVIGPSNWIYYSQGTLFSRAHLLALAATSADLHRNHLRTILPVKFFVYDLVQATELTIGPLPPASARSEVGIGGPSEHLTLLRSIWKGWDSPPIMTLHSALEPLGSEEFDEPQAGIFRSDGAVQFAHPRYLPGNSTEWEERLPTFQFTPMPCLKWSGGEWVEAWSKEGVRQQELIWEFRVLEMNAIHLSFDSPEYPNPTYYARVINRSERVEVLKKLVESGSVKLAFDPPSSVK